MAHQYTLGLAPQSPALRTYARTSENPPDKTLDK